MNETELKTLWQKILGEIEVEVGKTKFGLYFRGSSLLFLDEATARLGAPNSSIAKTLEDQYYGLIKKTLDKFTNSHHSLVFEISKRPAIIAANDFPLFTSSPTVQNERSLDRKNPEYQKTGLNPKYCFQNFVVGSANNLAFAAAQGVVKNPGLKHNPLFIYGGVGVGKTHLLQAIGNEIFLHLNLKVLYSNSEDFVNELIASINGRSASEFKKKFRDVDVLLIDDIQFIAGKDATQTEFFNTFNHLYLHEKQIVLTCDRPPEEMEKIEERLISRFRGGLVVDINKPDYEMRVAIIKDKAQSRGREIENEAALLVAEKTEATNIREIEGLLNRLAEISPENKITATQVRNFFGHKDERRALKPKNSKEVIAAVCQYFCLKQKDLLSSSRRQEFCLPRYLTMHLLKQENNLTLAKIAAALHRRDHTTVIHGLKIMQKELSTNPKLRHDFLSIKKTLWG